MEWSQQLWRRFCRGQICTKFPDLPKIHQPPYFGRGTARKCGEAQFEKRLLCILQREHNFWDQSAFAEVFEAFSLFQYLMINSINQLLKHLLWRVARDTSNPIIHHKKMLPTTEGVVRKNWFRMNTGTSWNIKEGEHLKSVGSISKHMSNETEEEVVRKHSACLVTG